MKKISMLIIISIFLTSIMAGVAYAEEKSLVKSALSKFGDMIEYLLGGIFKGISNNPNIWLRVIAFIAIYAVLFKVLETGMSKTAGEKFFDKKTVGILGFVLSFATASVMPIQWLIVALTMYSGLIMVSLMAVPVFYLGTQTYYVWKELSPSKFRIILVLIGWILYGAIVSTATLTLTVNAVVSSEWKEILDQTTKNTIVTGFIEILYIIIIAAAILLVIKMFLSTGGRILAPQTAPQTGGPATGILGRPFKGLFKHLGVGKSNLVQFIDICDDTITNIDAAKATATNATKNDSVNAMTNALNLLANLKTKCVPAAKAAITALQTAGIQDPRMPNLIQNKVEIERNINRSIAEITKAYAETQKNKTGWKKVTQALTSSEGPIKSVQAILTEIIRIQAKNP